MVSKSLQMLLPYGFRSLLSVWALPQSLKCARQGGGDGASYAEPARESNAVFLRI
jgi:hypothetical protein